MTETSIRDLIPDFAKDIRINISSVILSNTQTNLSQNQLYGSMLACAYALHTPELIKTIKAMCESILSAEEIHAAKAAACIMAMNNVYYRTMGQLKDEAFKSLPAGLRMQVIGNPGIEKLDFELYCLAISAINGCSTCVNAHINVAQKAGISNPDLQTIIKLGSVINAANTSIILNN
jgi:alkyl hydroperoxide reductase subunit D